MCVWVFFVFFFHIVEAPLPGAFSHALVKYVNRNALSMFKALNKVLLLDQVESRLKSLKNQH